MFDAINAEEIIYARISGAILKWKSKQCVELEGIKSRLSDMNLRSAIIVDDVAEIMEL